MWYSNFVVAPQSGNRKGVLVLLNYTIAFIISVLAGIAAYYICKWLDGDDSDN